MTLWLKVTADKYESQVAIADTAGQLAKMVGVSQNNIYSCVSNANKHGYRSQFIKVEIEEDDLNEIN